MKIILGHSIEKVNENKEQIKNRHHIPMHKQVAICMIKLFNIRYPNQMSQHLCFNIKYAINKHRMMLNLKNKNWYHMQAVKNLP